MQEEFVTGLSVDGSENPKLEMVSSIQMKDGGREFDLEYDGELDVNEICTHLKSFLRIRNLGHLKIHFEAED